MGCRFFSSGFAQLGLQGVGFLIVLELLVVDAVGEGTLVGGVGEDEGLLVLGVEALGVLDLGAGGLVEDCQDIGSSEGVWLLPLFCNGIMCL